MIEDGPTPQLSGGLGSATAGISMMTKPIEEVNQRPQYSMPGILHFLQTEWARFEMERSQWAIERAELQARIAFLQGERTGQENLKQDLVRRIKMLEFALKQERAKYHKLKYGNEPNQGDMKAPTFEKKDEEDRIDGEIIPTTNSNVNLKQGRQLLRQYLQEIGYTDTIIDVRSARVKNLLGIQNQKNEEKCLMVNGDQKLHSSFTQRRPANHNSPSAMVDGALMESEVSVMATFDFLQNENVVVDDDENLSDENDDEDDDMRGTMDSRGPRPLNTQHGNESMVGVDEMYADNDNEEAMAEFDFLVSDGGQGAGEARSHGDGTEWEKRDLSTNEEWGVDNQLISKLKEEYKKDRQHKKGQMSRPKRSALQAMLASLSNEDDPVTEMDQFTASSDTLVGDESEQTGVSSSSTPPFPVSPHNPMIAGVEDESLEVALGLGELAELTVNNEADPTSYDVSSTNEVFRKTWNAKYTLRSHFDGVRSLAFHPIEPVLITASEDHTLKLWNLQKTVPAKKATSLDVEPVYTFRGHVGPVLCLAMSPMGEHCYSGGVDATIRCWGIPNSSIDPYDSYAMSPMGEHFYSGGVDAIIRCWGIPNSSIDPYYSYDPNVLQDTLVAHTDSVHGLSIHTTNSQLLSCSSDGTVRLWSPGTKSPLVNTYRPDHDEGVPTSADFVRYDNNHLVVSYTSANTYIYDIETGQQMVALDTNQSTDSSVSNQINSIISHPTLPITITAHEDRQIRFFDNVTGNLIHSMVAHLDAVTSLAIDPNGLYLLSGSHDCSIRLWNLDSKTCIQEITSHRKKFDEAIHDVAFHPSKPYIASAGADALAKVFV